MENETKAKIVEKADKTDTKEHIDTPEELAHKEQERTTKKKLDFLKTFDESLGIVKICCDACNIGRATFYEWYNDDSAFRFQIERIRQEQMGDVEDRLLKAIIKEEPWAIRMYLNRVHPKYRPKQDNYVIPVGKTFEDIMDDHKKAVELEKEKQKEHGTDNANTTGDNRSEPQDKNEKGQADNVPPQPGPTVLLEKKDEEKHNTESPTKGNK